jgi:hypothetical protein
MRSGVILVSALATKNPALFKIMEIKKRTAPKEEFYNIYQRDPGSGAETLVDESLTKDQFMDRMEFYAQEYYMTQEAKFAPSSFRHEIFTYED